MKKIILILSVFMIVSCSQDDNLPTPAPVATPTVSNTSANTGTYIGNIDTYINGVFHSTTSKTITLSAINNSNEFLMVNNIFMTTTCDITNNNLNIPSHTTATATNYSVIEYGTGTFNGANLTIDFRQDQVTGSVVSLGKWTGTLIKQ